MVRAVALLAEPASEDEDVLHGPQSQDEECEMSDENLSEWPCLNELEGDLKEY